MSLATTESGASPTGDAGRPTGPLSWLVGRRSGLVILAYAAVLMGVVWLTYGPDGGPGKGGQLIFSDDFERGAPGEGWHQAGADQGWEAGQWAIQDGRLFAEKIHNAALWLERPLPEQVRIEFDARAHSGKGDVKIEVFGDGRTHQSGYIAIYGGWNNTVVALARQDEHGEDRKEDNRLCSSGPRAPRKCVEPNQDYHWVIERTDETVRWYVDGVLVLTYPDAWPLSGRHMAFNNWEAPTSFDNLKIYDLSGSK